MSDAATATAKVAGIGVKPLHVFIMGKVVRTRRYEQHWYTTIICPAADAYSRPSVVEVRSKSKFAERDEETKCNAILGGYEGKSYKATDRESGEMRTVTPVQLFLDLVE